MTVAKGSSCISEEEPIVCVHSKSYKKGMDIPGSRYEIRTSSTGISYVADFASYGGRTWRSIGPWGGNEESVPSDNIALQILKPFKKN